MLKPSTRVRVLLQAVLWNCYFAGDCWTHSFQLTVGNRESLRPMLTLTGHSWPSEIVGGAVLVCDGRIALFFGEFLRERVRIMTGKLEDDLCYAVEGCCCILAKFLRAHKGINRIAMS